MNTLLCTSTAYLYQPVKVYLFIISAYKQGRKMKKLLVILFATMTLLNAACTVEKTTPIDVTWTGYKTPKKIGVNGGFLAIVYKGKTKADSVPSMLLKSQVMIEANNVDSKNSFRDAKLVQFFFNMMQGAVLVADVVSIKGDDKSGTLVVNVGMNNKAIDVPMTYTVNSGKLQAKGKLDLLDFNAQEPLKMLTLNCYALHEGKTWRDVEVRFSFDINKSCDE